MKNFKFLLGTFFLCIFALTSCQKEEVANTVNQELDASTFMKTNPSLDEVKTYFADAPSNGKLGSMDDEVLKNASPTKMQHDCSEFVTGTFFFSGPNAGFYGYDLDGVSCYVTILKRNGSTIDWVYHDEQTSIYYTTPIPDCGTYLAETWAMEHGCPGAGWEVISSATKYYPNCW